MWRLCSTWVVWPLNGDAVTPNQSLRSTKPRVTSLADASVEFDPRIDPRAGQRVRIATVDNDVFGGALVATDPHRIPGGHRIVRDACRHRQADASTEVLVRRGAGKPRREWALRKVTLEAFDWARDSDKFVAWLAQPHVARWWGDAARAILHARTCPSESHALIVVDGVPVGYLSWLAAQQDEFAAVNLADVPSGLVDIDILVGDPDATGQGVGSRALELLLARLGREPSIAFAGLGSSAANSKAIRCFEKAGFRLHREFLDPEWGPCKYLIAEVRRTA